MSEDTQFENEEQEEENDVEAHRRKLMDDPTEVGDDESDDVEAHRRR